MRFVCPDCGSGGTLWEGIAIGGWRSIDEKKQPTGEREADWSWVESDGNAGCGDCNWYGRLTSLRETMPLGIDGEELPRPIEGQIEIISQETVA